MPMSLFTLAIRLHLSRSQYLLFLPRPVSCSVSSSITSSLFPIFKPFISSLFVAFHRTASIPSETTRRFSTSRYVYNGSLDDPFELVEQGARTPDPLVSSLLESLKYAARFPSEADGMASIDGSGIRPNAKLVFSVIWELREEWRLAFLAFKWAEKWDSVDEKACELMVWVLGCNRKFNTAWILIRELHDCSMNTRRPMLVMIERYAAANDPSKAIKTFHIMEKFKMTPDDEAFFFLLNALCKHGNIEEAEELMLANKKLFPLQTEGFNIILNGWCNLFMDVLEAKRVWREMSKCCIMPDATSYTLMISCFSKSGNLFDSLRLYDLMKKRGWILGREVYNSLIYVLTRENCINEAVKILDKMKEIGLLPDSSAYNSMIHPLCETKKLEEARNILATMIEEKVSPTLETYHAILECTDFEETLELLSQMKTIGLGPTGDTFLLIIERFFKLKEPENALKIWAEMKQYQVVPNLTHHRMLVERLVRSGLLIKARECYAEMRSHGFSDDPKLQKVLMEPAEDKYDARKQPAGEATRKQHATRKKGNMIKKKIPECLSKKE